jgi:S1-C subfamily serine protease
LCIGVANRLGTEPEARFRVAAAADRRPEIPTDLRFPPYHRAADLNPTDRIAECVVEVSVRSGGGSAVCVHPAGFLVTCSHVLEDEDEPGGIQSDDILVAFADDFREAPRQRYIARRIASDASLDLAILRIVSDVYGRPLPKDPRLPYVRWGAPGRVRLGRPSGPWGIPSPARSGPVPGWWSRGGSCPASSSPGGS